MVSCTDSDIVFAVQDGGHFNGLETSDAKGYHIERGYADLVGDLRALGAEIRLREA